MDLSEAIPDGATVLVDTAPLVYLFEYRSLFEHFVRLFERIDAGQLQALITPITLAEIVAGPLRHGNEVLAERYRRSLTNSAGWTLCDIDADLAMLAARLRVRYRLRRPDAIQLAAALRHCCDALVTHDRDFAGVTEIAVLGIDPKR